MAAKKKIKTVKITKSNLPVVESPERTLPLLEKFLQYGLLLIVLLSPYYRGLYFDYERYPFFLAVFLLAIIYFFYQIAYQRKVITIKTRQYFPPTVLLYGLSILGCGPRDGFRTFRSVLLYLSFGHKFIPDQHSKKFLITFNINAVLLVLLGFSTIWVINPLSRPLGMSMKDLLAASGRLHSTMQYPNTLLLISQWR